MTGSNTYVPGTNTYTLAGSSPQDQANNLFALAWNAGFRGQDAIRAVAIAMAENGGSITNLVYQDPTGPAGPEYSIGPWQINIGTVAGRYDNFNAGQLADPFNNAAAAFQKYKDSGGSFRPWTTFTSGKYQQYMGYATAAALQVRPGGIGSPLTSILEAIKNLIHSTVSVPGEIPGDPGGSGGGGSGTPSDPSELLPMSAVIVVTAGIFFLLLGAIAWKGADAVKVIAPGSAPAKAMRIAGS